MILSKEFLDGINVGIPGIDTWESEAISTIENQLGLSDYESSMNKITYFITDSDTFSRIYSKINKSTEFNYTDNESFYDDTNISLAYTSDIGKVILSGDLATDSYKLEVTR